MSALDRDLTLALAKAQANLDLIASRADILSDLADLKEVRKLESDCARTIRDLAKAGRVPADPLAVVEQELRDLTAWAAQVQALIDGGEELVDEDLLESDDDQAGRIGTAELQALGRRLTAYRNEVDGKAGELARHRPAACFVGQHFDPRLAVMWQIRVTGRTQGWSGLGEAMPAFDTLRGWAETSGGRAGVDRASLVQNLAQQQALISKLEAESVAERDALAAALALLETGEPKAARALVARRKAVRFSDPLWATLVGRLGEMEGALAEVEGAGANGKVIAAAGRVKAGVLWSKVTPTSEMGATLLAREAAARRGRLRTWMAIAAVVAVVAVAGAYAKRAYDEDQRLQALATEAKAEAERVAAAKAKAEREAKAEAERVAAAKAMAELDRLRNEGKLWQVAEVGLSLVPIPAGSFLMGSDDQSRTDERPVTRVTLREFWLAQTEVTQAQWKAVMGSAPSFFKGDTLPVETVSWEEAMEFCRKVTERERAAGRLPTGMEYTLPTEAQWEYACRAGTTSDHAGDLDAMAWYTTNGGSSTHRVATKRPNAWGLYDMHGNVWEWCRDWYGNYPGGSVTDPAGAASGSRRVNRGGSWGYEAGDCRSANRSRFSPDFRTLNLGFRPALISVP